MRKHARPADFWYLQSMGSMPFWCIRQRMVGTYFKAPYDSLPLLDSLSPYATAWDYPRYLGLEHDPPRHADCRVRDL